VLDRDPFQVAIGGDERLRSLRVGEARMIPEDEERRVREPPVGVFRSGIVEQPGDERQRRRKRATRFAASGTRKTAVISK
jgi:hypothetical protein